MKNFENHEKHFIIFIMTISSLQRIFHSYCMKLCTTNLIMINFWLLSEGNRVKIDFKLLIFFILIFRLQL